MQRLANAWRLSKASWQVLSRDRGLLAIPLIAGAGAVFALALFLLPGVVLVGDSNAVDPSDVAFWLLLLLGLIAVTWITAIGQGAVVAAAAERMDGGDPSIGSSFAAARARGGYLLSWGVLATALGVVLDQIEQRFGALGKLAAWLGGIAFSIMSFLALPVIVFENVGAIEGFKRSSLLVRQTWGEQIGFNFAMGLLRVLLMLPGVVIGAGLVVTDAAVLQALGIVTMIVWIPLVWVVVSALSAVFMAALYRFAHGLPVDPAYDADDLTVAFRPR